MNVNLFIHLANILFLLSYLVRDIFLLRILTLVAGFMLLPYYFFVENGPLSEPIIWSIVFSCVNIYQLIVLFNERKPIVLDKEQQEIFEQSFQNFSPKQFLNIYSAARQTNLEQGKVLGSPNERPQEVYYILSGIASIEQSTSNHALKQGDFVAAIQHATNTTLNHKIKVTSSTVALQWNGDELDKLLQKDIELKSSWQGLITTQLCKDLNLS